MATTYQFRMENLNCAHCAGMIEEAVRQRSEIESVVFSFATKKMMVRPSEGFLAVHKDEEVLWNTLQVLLQTISDDIEDGVSVQALRTTSVGSTADAHHHDHDHDHGVMGWWTYVEVIVGFFLVLVAELTDWLPKPYATYALVGMYLIVARYVLLTAIRNVARGRILDENFLMGVATLGAFALGDFAEGLGVMIFYRIGVIFEEKATERSRQEIMSVIDMRPEVVTLVTENGKCEIPAEEARVGDILQVRPGDRIPLDGVVVSGESRIDTSPVTGEPKPVAASTGTAVTSGCINLSGALEMRVEKLLAESFVSKMLEAVEHATANKPTVDRFITRFARYYTPVVIGLTIMTILVPGFLTGDWDAWIYTGLTFLVISCPCALVLSVPLAFFAGIGGSSKLGVLFKGGLSMEMMSHVKVIALDKTGTITQGRFAVDAVESYVEGRWVPAVEADRWIALCASAEGASTHPIAVSLRERAQADDLPLYAQTEVQEYAGEGLVAVVDGHRVVAGNVRLLDRLGITYPVDTVGQAGTTAVYLAVDGTFVARILIRDTIKADAKSALQALEKAGYTVAMVTGDAADSANAVAKETGIAHVFAGLLPTGKLDVLGKLRSQFGSIMFVGDGINDAPVLAGANVGCAMGSGADAALEAADVVYMNSEVGAVVRSLAMAKKTMRIAWQNVAFAIGLKVFVMLIGLFGYASLWLAIFADTGVMILCVLNAIRLLYPGRALRS